MKLNQILGLTTAVVAVAVMGSTLRTSAQEKGPAVNPAGTWQLETITGKSQPGTAQILNLKLEGRKLTGTLSRQAGSKVEQLPLEDTKLEGSAISFAVKAYALIYDRNVLQPVDTNKVTHSKFRGEISGDVIKGKVERKSWRDELSRTMDWEAKRVSK